jgi:hypothetical protein
VRFVVSPERFYLGTHRPHWLAKLDVPLFVSHRTLRDRRTYPRALGRWALDSGGFTELSTYGEWRTPPGEYVTAVRRYRDEVGGLDWASPQDWMCEPVMLAKTGLTVAEHQRRTVDNYLQLRDMDAQLPFVPVLQGWERDDYLRCADLYTAAGIDLTVEPTVGVGTVCRRQDTGHARHIMTSLARLGIRIHGFGVKIAGLRVYGESMLSADSMAWSYRARSAALERRGSRGPDCGKRTCANCAHFALDWRESALRSCRSAQPEMLALFDL